MDGRDKAEHDGRSRRPSKYWQPHGTGPSKTEIREYPMLDVPPDAALMKMEVGGIFGGTDVALYKHPPSNRLTIMLTKITGYIAKAAREFKFSARVSRKATSSSFEHRRFPVSALVVPCRAQAGHAGEHQLAHQSRRDPLWLHLG